ncbi:hypothetical protein [Treponema sp.]|uniref:hypothetical protein n=1 Tax=Treponema sp. TaxID=166 RepID=UPI00388E73DE
MKKFFFTLISIFLIFSNVTFAADSSTSTTNYDDINFPQWSRDLRRTEIITFGSLPFVTLWTTVGYSLYKYGKFKNPLDKSTSSFTEDDQWNIIKISAVTCVGLGLTDLAINLITRDAKERKIKKSQKNQAYSVIPESEMERKPPQMNESETDEQAEERLKREFQIESQERPGILIEGIENILF